MFPTVIVQRIQFTSNVTSCSQPSKNKKAEVRYFEIIGLVRPNETSIYEGDHSSKAWTANKRGRLGHAIMKDKDLPPLQEGAKESIVNDIWARTPYDSCMKGTSQFVGQVKLFSLDKKSWGTFGSWGPRIDQSGGVAKTSSGDLLSLDDSGTLGRRFAEGYKQQVDGKFIDNSGMWENEIEKEAEQAARVTATWGCGGCNSQRHGNVVNVNIERTKPMGM
jgi:hypothetical protein